MTKRAAVLGWPISHSRSPLIHGSWIKLHKLDASYEPIALDPADASDWFAHFADHGLVGVNVTIPHKEVALAACDHLTQRAQRLGAANTLWLDSGQLHGTSTDGEGFMANLTDWAPGWADHPKANRALIIGAGGAARAIIDALLDQGTEQIILLNRTVARAQSLADHFNGWFGSGRVLAASLDNFQSHAPDTGLLVNTSALGMVGQPPLHLPLDNLAEGAAVADIVYTPLQTPLLADAKKRGHPTIDGLGMLLHQAVPGFERWFGVRPAVSGDLRQLILDDINKKT